MPLGILLKTTCKNLAKRLKDLWLNWRPGKKSLDDLAKKQILRLTTNRRWPTWGQWKRLPSVLSKGEKQILRAALVVGSCACLTLGGWWLAAHRTVVPVVGGSYTEGLVGSPQFINPLYASASDVDSDLVSLIYSGLFRSTPEGLQPDLAESYTVSEDQKTYTIKLRGNAEWHNGDPVRSSDVLFTIQSLQDPAYHSPLAISFRGLTVSEVDELTVQFVLEEPFAPFLSSLTVGILPSAIWAELPAKNFPLTSLNLSPIGSGPYKFEKYAMEKTGEIKSYTLVRNPAYYGQPAKIEHLIFKFYNDLESAVAALENQNIEGVSFLPNQLAEKTVAEKKLSLLRPDMAQVTTLFFNQKNQPLLEDDDLRQALAMSINKQAIVNEVLSDHGSVVTSLFLPHELGFDETASETSYNPTEALALLDKTDFTVISPDGFRSKKVKKTENGETAETLEELTLTLTTVNQPVFIKTAEVIAEQAKLVGIKIQTEIVEPADLFEKIIKPRAYQMLLTATQHGLDPDPYPFWHSSQTKDSGLNLAMFSNRQADELLEKARATNNPEDRMAAYKEFQLLVNKELPAVFLFQPTYAYAVSEKIKNLSLEQIILPTDRFQNITEWYIKTKNVIK